MKKQQDCLIELLTEEMPPKELQRLANALKNELSAGLKAAHLDYNQVRSFATPRRLAVLFSDLSAVQPTQTIEKQGPALEAAFNEQQQPTPACVGFAKSCGVLISELQRKETPKGIYLVYTKTIPSKSILECLPSILQNAVDKLPIAKYMRWGNSTFLFVRPLHSLIVLYGNKVVPCQIFGIKASNQTSGHRFMTSKKLVIKKPSDYELLLRKKGFVIADYEKRKEEIRQQLNQVAAKNHAIVKISEDLLDEVTSLVEWPCALAAHFAETFLKLPIEVLMTFMKVHQRSFPLFDQQGHLKPIFITVSNIESRQPKKVIEGNEKVMKARLSDAQFFYENDLKQSLESRVPDLKQIIFQASLGTLWDKTQRLLRLSAWIAKTINANLKYAERATLLAKTDLITSLVNEFPELQGTMGYYYALQNAEPPAVAQAIKEQYAPKGVGDPIPSTREGKALAIADRIDLIVGLFSINKKPTGDKDPFGLRRAAIGIIRIILESKPPLAINLQELIDQAVINYGKISASPKISEEVFAFILDRLKTMLSDQGFTSDEIQAVTGHPSPYLDDLMLRIQAVQQFKSKPEAKNLASANKRVSHLLAKTPVSLADQIIDHHLLQDPTELKLATLIAEKKKDSAKWLKEKNYTELLFDLAVLRDPVDQFFDHVMVMVEDEALRKNRLILLSQLRQLFLQVADISVLQL